MPSVFSSPNPILFGRGVSALAGEKLNELGCTRVLVVFDRGVRGIAAKVIGSINAAGIGTVAYDGVLADPPDYTVDAAGALGVAEGVDGVVGIGGGSSLDTAKGALILRTNPPPISRYFVRPDAPPPDYVSTLKPLVVMPTTAGTGSEATPGGVITDTANHDKRIIICPVTLALVDPELTLGLPPLVTAATGFDALCHAVEALTSNAPNAFSETLGKEAVVLVGRYLARACRDGADVEAREGMALAASLGGMSILGPYCHIPHDIGQPLGSLFHIPHGIACAVTLAETMRFVAPAVPARVRIVAEALGAAVPPGAPPEEIGAIARDAVNRLAAAVQLPGPQAFVESKERLYAVIPEVFKVPTFRCAPRSVGEQDVRQLLGRAWDASR